MKGMLPRTINILAIISIFEFLKKPIESLCVEKTSGSDSSHCMTYTIENCHSKYPIK
jgi:hypothetical protein